MTRLGAILAGGRSTRFGSDKAEAMLHGKPLIEHVIAALATQCDETVVCGRKRDDSTCLPDRPGSGEGPLGGLNAALHYAEAHGHGEVLSAACDNADLPADAAEQLFPPPAYVADQPVIGLWPAEMAEKLDEWLESQPNRAMMGWIEASGARPVRFVCKTANINSPSDLAALEGRNGI